ncbi:MAG TPA: carboxypeptidase-like regulatory domain-containing protein, partial [Pyrinomonadaceae bacterium]|nr:carboxypeptidase-like regulatory domain-containing protein [Pyrinomonadaceae bacterium]
VLTGTVYDRQGAAIPGVAVSLSDQKGHEFAVRTDDSGTYRIEVQPAFYLIKFERSGFKSIKLKRFYISASYRGSMLLDVSMVEKIVSGHI